MLESRCVMASDFGDAPDTGAGFGVNNYETFFANGGPSHVIDTTQTSLFLGRRVDAEVDAAASVRANGDDLYVTPSTDDEDGVIDPDVDLLLTAGSIPQVRLRATNTTGTAATLYGWIDVNRDGVFNNATERASMNVPTASNNAVFNLEFPLVALTEVGGKTFARFRLSTDVAAANPNGVAADGEVEDYTATVTRISTGHFDTTKSTRIADSLLGGPVLQNTDLYGSATATLGDLDGSGRTFVAVGAPGRDGVGTDSGVVYLTPILTNGSAGISILLTSGVGGVPTYSAGDRFGTSLAAIGDINGDGVMDLAVGAPGDDTGGTDRGAIYLLRMNTNGTVNGFTKISSGTLNLTTIANGDAFGTSIALVPDLDGDGVSELAVGSSLSDLGGTDRGAVSILFLNADITIKSSVIIASNTGGGPTLINGDRFGASVASIGDLNGDGVGDIAVGANADDTGYAPSTTADSGAVYVLFLNAAGVVTSRVKVAKGFNGGPTDLSLFNQFGSSIASVGDLDGDGINDLSVGATDFFSSGAIYNLFMNANGTVKAFRSLSSFGSTGLSLNFGDDFAASIAYLGDLDGDSIPELAVGTPGDDTNGTDRGGLRIMNLRADNVAPIATVRRQSPTATITNADTLTFRVSFDEDVFNVDPSDLNVTGSTATIQSVTNVGINSFDVVISGGDLPSLNASVSLAVATGRNIVDRLGNLLANGNPSGRESFTVDNTAPIATSFTRIIPNVSLTSADAVRFLVTFNESVTNVDASDFIVVGSTATITSTGSGTTYELTLSGGNLANLSGTVGINFAATQNILDRATNPLLTLEPDINETFSIVQSTLDFGDAPDTGVGTGVGNYQTSLADNGPRHTIVSGLRLGARVDAEPDGLTLDDGPNISPALDDEDGLIDGGFEWSVTIGSSPRVRLRATNTSGSAATLYGWIDVNRNGVFDNTTERASVTVPNGSNNAVFSLQFPAISPGFSPGVSQARFRLSTDTAAASSIGAATNGEVEDYSVRLLRASDGTAESGKSKKIESGVNNGVAAQFTSNGYGSSVLAVGDVNGDGIVDLAVGARLADNLITDIGIVYTQLMNRDGTSTSVGTPIGAPSSTSRSGFGTSLASLGNFADGVADIVVGAPTADTGFGPGAVYAQATSSGASSQFLSRIPTFAFSTVPALASNDAFGSSVASLGDLDGDGAPDIAVGAFGDDTGGTDRGSVHILFLNANRTLKSAFKIASGLNGGPVLGNGDRFGSSIANIGDLDGDGISDIVVGAALDDTGGADRGAIYVLLLNSNGSVKSSTKIASGLNGGPVLTNGDQFGYSIASIGDLNGDSVPDLAVGAPSDNTGATDAGAIYLLNLQPNGGVRSSTKIARSTNGGPSTLASSDRFGTSIASLGDLDNDGVIDLAVGAEGNTALVNFNGSVHTIFLRRDLDAPSLNSIQTQGSSPTNADTLTFNVSFSESVFNVSNDDFTVTGTTATVTSVTPLSGQSFTLVVSGGNLASFNGIVGLDISPSANIVDASNNLLVFVEPPIDQTFILDNAAPVLQSFVRLVPTTSTTSADVLRFRATFNESALQVDNADFVAAGTTAIVTVTPVSTTVYDITLSGGDLAYALGSVGINVAPGISIQDGLGNSVAVTEPVIDETYTMAFYGTDFGDAPDDSIGTGVGNYRTNLNDNGPRHTMVPGLMIGGFIDDEPDGQLSDDALETSLVNDDEDGLAFATDLNFIQGQKPIVRVRATNLTSTQATLYGWIDTNRDGVFDNATERASITVPVGSNNQTFSLAFGALPYNASIGASFARFRFSTDLAAAESFGLASDGEVEDYLATIVAAPPAVIDRRVFYNNALGFGTSGDNDSPLVNPINAIDPTKQALLPGATTTTDHYTNYSRGLNGIVVDLSSPGNLGAISPTSFQFATWSGFTIDTPNFVEFTPTVAVSTFAGGGVGGSDRVKLVFGDRVIENAWLRITVMANSNTGLSTNDVFYFGNARFDVTPASSFPSLQVTINVLDTNSVRARNGQSPSIVSNMFDVDRSGSVNVLDTNATRAANGTNSLRSFTAPGMLAPLSLSSSSITMQSPSEKTTASIDQFFIDLGSDPTEKRLRKLGQSALRIS